MFSKQGVGESESVTLKQTKPIWALAIMFKTLNWLGIDLGIHFTYWGKPSNKD